MIKYSNSFEKRKIRIRKSLRKKAYGKLRLSVFKSNSHLYVQVIDDAKGQTLVSASSKDKEFNTKKASVNKAFATEIGKLIAKRAIEKKIKEVVFDRGGHIYHGRIKALADGAREAGLKF
jgi:large subunit ribosomal protein L18